MVRAATAVWPSATFCWLVLVIFSLCCVVSNQFSLSRRLLCINGAADLQSCRAMQCSREMLQYQSQLTYNLTEWILNL